MSYPLRCAACQVQYQSKTDPAGRKMKCPKCGQELQPVPAKAAAAASPKPAGNPTPASAAKPVAAAAPPAESAVRKINCPHCDALVPADQVYCPECRLALRQKRRIDDASNEFPWKESLLVAGGIGGALVTMPIFFLIVRMVTGPHLALLICALEVNFIAAVGSFSLACRLFGQEPPDPGEVFRIVGYSTLPANLLLGWIGGGGILSVLAGGLVAAVVAALICMFQLGIPVFASIYISVSYNIFSSILTVVGVLLLAVLFLTSGVQAIPDAAPPIPEDEGVPPDGFDDMPSEGDDEDTGDPDSSSFHFPHSRGRLCHNDNVPSLFSRYPAARGA
jgi:hypothetical protein